MFTKVIRFGLYGSVISSGTLLGLDYYQQDGINSNGVIRFGRAISTVNNKKFFFVNSVNFNIFIFLMLF